MRHILPGMDAGYRVTYVNAEGVLLPRTDWMRISSVDHTTGAVSGHHLHTGEAVKVHIDLIHTTSSPFEHL